MEKILKLSTLNIWKKGFFRNLLISLFALICFSFLVSTGGTVKAVPSMLLQIIPYVFLVIFSFSLTQEFANKTDKMIFTGIFTRNEIMLSKLISFMYYSLTCFIFYEAISAICDTFDTKIIFKSLGAFFIYTFALGSFILLVSVMTSNFIITGIVSYVLYFDLILVLLNQALCSSKNQVLKQIIAALPFYIANTGFYSQNYTLHQSVIMLGSGFLFFTLACVIINRKNM